MVRLVRRKSEKVKENYNDFPSLAKKSDDFFGWTFIRNFIPANTYYPRRLYGVGLLSRFQPFNFVIIIDDTVILDASQ